jgi:hypothetical protein
MSSKFKAWMMFVGFIIAIGGMWLIETWPAATLVLFIVGGGMMIPAYSEMMQDTIREWERLSDEEKKKRANDYWPPF